MPLLTNNVWQTVLAESLDRACKSEGFGLVAFVLMPEHVHLLVVPQTQNSNVSRLLARTKQPTSKTIKGLLNKANSPLLSKLTVRERPGKHCFRFWQEGPGYDRNIFSSEAIKASIDYIHMNAVKRCLCEKATDWKWSSARFYLNEAADSDLPDLTRPDPSWFEKL